MRWVLLLFACNQAALPSNNGDGGAVDLRQTSEFCSGQARVELNGMRAESPSAMARLVFLNCCEAAEFSMVSMQIAEPLTFMWRSFVGGPRNTPATIDLANPPQEWGFMLASGCTSLQTGCQPTDSLMDGFTGTLTVEGDFNGYEMSLCLSATPTMAHPVLKSVRMWIPTISAR